MVYSEIINLLRNSSTKNVGNNPLNTGFPHSTIQRKYIKSTWSIFGAARNRVVKIPITEAIAVVGIIITFAV